MKLKISLLHHKLLSSDHYQASYIDCFTYLLNLRSYSVTVCEKDETTRKEKEKIELSVNFLCKKDVRKREKT